MLSTSLAVLALGAAPAATALAQGEPPEGGEGTGPTAPFVSADLPGATLKDVLSKGQPFLCGQAANAKRGLPDIACRIEAKVTIKSAVAKFVGLHSTVIADGVASNVTDHYKDADGRDQGRAYFLTVPSSVRSKLKAKHVRALGVHISGRITSPGQSRVYCANDDTSTHPSCALQTEKRTIWSAEDGEMVCWRYMPWYLATPIAYGKMCPKPKNI